MIHVEDEYSVVLSGLQDWSRGTLITKEDLEEVFFGDIFSSIVNSIRIIDICAF